jgi:hypothetical protein
MRVTQRRSQWRTEKLIAAALTFRLDANASQKKKLELKKRANLYDVLARFVSLLCPLLLFFFTYIRVQHSMADYAYSALFKIILNYIYYGPNFFIQSLS